MAPVRWFDEEQEPSPFLKALEEVRRMATREGWRYEPNCTLTAEKSAVEGRPEKAWAGHKHRFWTQCQALAAVFVSSSHYQWPHWD